MVGRWGGISRGSCTVGGSGGQIITTLSFITNDGSEITFRDDLTNGQPVLLGAAACSSTIGNRGTSWHSVNGEGATFISDTIITDSDMSGEFFPSGYLLTKDGTRSRIDNGNVTWTRDRNGNKISYTYQGANGGGNGGPGSSSQLLTATDSLNRQISISYGNPSPTIITFKGFGGATRTIEIGYNSLGNVLRYDQTLKTWQQLWPDLPEGGSATFNPNEVPAYVKLPDGRYYYFKYNSYRELARVELPTGGAMDYDWSGMTWITYVNANTTYKEIRRWVTEKRIYPNGGTGANYTTRTTFASSQGNSPTTGSSSTYDANGNVLDSEAHNFYGGNFVPSTSADYAPYTEGKEYSSTVWNGGTAVKSTNQTWENRAHVSWWTISYDLEPANDPRVTDITTTLHENNLVSKVHTDYDDSYPYNNPKDVWEYDYGTGAPGALIRRTHTEYAYVVNGTNYATDTNIHLRGLPALTQVFDGAGNKKSETTVEYDVYSGTNHAALVDRTGIVGLDAAFTTSKTTRGNVTLISQWLDSPSSYLSGYSQYDIAGNVVKSIDAKGNSDAVGYTDNFSNPANNIGTFAFATSMSTPIPDPTGTYASNTALTVSTKYDYDTGKVVSSTDANNQLTTMDYTGDLLDRPKQINKPDGGITQFSYGDGVGFGNLYVRTQTKLNATQWTDSYVFLDGLGRAKQTKAWEGGTTWTYKDTNYDAMGRAYQVSNPYRTTATEWTTTIFDRLGRVTQVTSPDGAHVDTAYYGNQVLATDQAGKKRMSETDALGRLLKVWEITPADAQTVTVTFPGQSFNAGYLTTYGYDLLDNLTTVTQGTQSRSFVYDSLKRLKQATNPESGTINYSYDNNGNLLTKSDARGITATYSYDALNRNTTIRYNSYPNGTFDVDLYYDGATNGKGRFWYNVAYNYKWELATDNLAYHHTKTDSYDVMGRPLQHSQQFLIKENGNWVWKPYNLSRTYNLAGNILTQTYPSGRVVNYSYNTAGQLTSFTGKLGGLTGAGNTDVNYATDLKYNPRGQMIRETFGTNAALYHRMYYNRRGQLFDIRLGTSSDAAYDVEDPAVWRWANGTWNRGALRLFYSSTGSDYDPYTATAPVLTNNNGNPYRMDHFVPNAVDGSDNITSWVMGTHWYNYDDLNRVTQVGEVPTGGSGSGFIQAFNYDRWGNRTINVGATSGVGGGVTRKTFTISATNNRLTGIDGVPVGYDAVGNQTTISTSGQPDYEQRDYDPENRMTKAIKSGQSNYYFYDANGKRTRRIINATQGTTASETWMVYGFDGELVAEYAYNGATGSPQKEYGYRGGQMLVVFDSTETGDDQLKWLVTDHLGSTRMLVNRSGSLAGIKRRDYLPFGEELDAGLGHRTASGAGYPASNKPKQKFTGYERDDETGLDFAHTRYYANVQGRFTTPDIPFADQNEDEPQSWNLYTYVINNPLSHDDPFGLWKRIKTNDGSVIYEAEKDDTFEGLADILQIPVSALVGAFGGDKIQVGQQFDVTNYEDYKSKLQKGIEQRQYYIEQPRDVNQPFDIYEPDPSTPWTSHYPLINGVKPRRNPFGNNTFMSQGRWLGVKQAARELANNVLKEAKASGVGKGAKSGQHGRPYTSAATKLRGLLKQNEKNWLPEFKKIIEDKIEKYIQHAKATNEKI